MSIGSMVDRIEERYCADMTDVQKVDLKVSNRGIEQKLLKELEESACKAVLSVKARIKHSSEVPCW